jgi:muramoyltetrapeptide carboxypeptidase LdcA involved in peptidoglycan recycling
VKTGCSDSVYHGAPSAARPIPSGPFFGMSDNTNLLAYLCAPNTTIVFDVDYGHTDPQLVIPYGGLVRVDGPARRITVTY